MTTGRRRGPRKGLGQAERLRAGVEVAEEALRRVAVRLARWSPDVPTEHEAAFTRLRANVATVRADLRQAAAAADVLRDRGFVPAPVPRRRQTFVIGQHVRMVGATLKTWQQLGDALDDLHVSSIEPDGALGVIAGSGAGVRFVGYFRAAQLEPVEVAF
jgi:hypothetical protein